MQEPPSIDEMLRGAFSDLNDENVRIFYAYFEELKQHVRRYLSKKPRLCPGESHVAQSAMFSLFCDLAVQSIPLQDVDEHGYPMLWPLLLKYVERHCEKWKKYYRAKKRSAPVVALGSTGQDSFSFDLPDHRGIDDENAVGDALSNLYARLTPRQQRVADLSAQGKTLEEIASEIGCSESLVSLEKKAIRTILETA